MKIDNDLLKYLSSYKLSGKEFEILIAIANGICLKVELENFLGMSRQNLHKYVKGLKEKGLIRQKETFLHSPVYEVSINKDDIIGQETFYDVKTFTSVVNNCK